MDTQVAEQGRFYIVRKDVWYIERSVWLISGVVALASTLLALFVDPAWVLVVALTGLSSLAVAATGVCPVGSLLLQAGVPPMLAEEPLRIGRLRLYRMRTDSWFLERGVYAVVGTNLTLASLLALVHSPWWLAFTGFVGTASVVFAATGFCPVANVLYWLGFEPRLLPAADAACPRRSVAAGRPPGATAHGSTG